MVSVPDHGELLHAICVSLSVSSRSDRLALERGLKFGIKWASIHGMVNVCVAVAATDVESFETIPQNHRVP